MIDAPSTQPSLLIRIRDERDSDSWSRFVATYSPLIREYLRRRGLQDADTADVTQEVLSRVATAIQEFEYQPERGTFRAWLFTIVTNCFKRYCEGRRPGQQGTGDTHSLRALAALPAADEESEWNREYERCILMQAVNDIRCDFQESTWLAFWATAVEGRKADEVASELRLSVAAVYMARHRVTGRLREHVRYLEGARP